jgi:DNA-binding XRE family transcriptional regulator
MEPNRNAVSIAAKAAVALRAARIGLGWNQETAAAHAGVAKTTIARIETLAGQISLENVFHLISVYEAQGVFFSDLKLGEVQLTFREAALQTASELLQDPGRKRKDLGKSRPRKPKTPAPDAQEGSTGGRDGEPGQSDSSS